MSTVLDQTKCRHVSSAGSVNSCRKFSSASVVGYQQRNCRSAQTAEQYKRNSIHADPYEQVYIEDLEHNSQRALRIPIAKSDKDVSNSLGSTNRRALLHKQLLSDVFVQGDFTVYQDGDLADFFGEAVPQRVTEVCLVNDHYILVKMPETCWRRNSQIECIMEESVTAEQALESVHNRNELLKNDECKNGTLAKLWQYKRNRRVCPADKPSSGAIEHADEQADEHDKHLQASNKFLQKNTFWQASGKDKEVFQSRTKIVKGHLQVTTPQDLGVDASTTDCEQQLQEHAEDLSAQKDKNERTEDPEVFGSPLRFDCNEGAQKQLILQNSALQTSLHDAVALEPQGFMVTPVKSTLENGRLVEVYETTGVPSNAQHRLRVRRRFSAIRWLLKPFRTRTKTKQPTPKTLPRVHAVVYKTYFVRWKKPPVDLWQGRGTRSELSASVSSEDAPTLRRSRSATF